MQVLLQEAGGHRVQRIPPTEKRGRVHTSSVTVAVFDSQLAETIKPLTKRDVRIEWFSGTGSGGQHRNKCQNSCRVIHKDTGFMEIRQGRSRESNLSEAMEFLSRRLHDNAKKMQSVIVNDQRRSQIGEGLRGDKIRTYRFQENCVINHLNQKRSRCSKVMRGSFDSLWD